METNYARIIERRCQEKIIMKESKILIHKHSENCLVGARNEKKKKKNMMEKITGIQILKIRSGNDELYKLLKDRREEKRIHRKFNDKQEFTIHLSN